MDRRFDIPWIGGNSSKYIGGIMHLKSTVGYHISTLVLWGWTPEVSLYAQISIQGVEYVFNITHLLLVARHFKDSFYAYYHCWGF